MKMTNEELVKLIQDGQEEYIPQRWDQVYLFICRMDKKRLIGEVHRLERAASIIKEVKPQELLLTMLDSNGTFAEACRILKVPEEKRHSMTVMYNSALRQIRRYLRGRAWQQCRQIGIDEYLSIGLRGSGLIAYRNNGFTSSTERAAIRLVDNEAWYKKLIEMMG